MPNSEIPLSELKEAIKEFLSSAERHGQVYDLVPFSVMASLLKLIDLKHCTKYYDSIVKVYIELSRSAPMLFDTYMVRVISKIAEGLQHKTEVISQIGKKTKILG